MKADGPKLQRIVCVLVTTVALLGACTPPPRYVPSPVERDAFGAAERGWVEAGLPFRSSCLEGARIEWARDAADFEGRCGRTAWEAAECLIWDRGGGAIRKGPRYAIALLRPGEPVDDWGEPAVHAAMHALTACAGLGKGLDLYDKEHLNPLVWHDAPGSADRAGSAQGRARRLYRER